MEGKLYLQAEKSYPLRRTLVLLGFRNHPNLQGNQHLPQVISSRPNHPYKQSAFIIYEGALALDFRVNVFSLNLPGERINQFLLAELSRINSLIFTAYNLLYQHGVVVLVGKPVIVRKFNRA